MAEPIIKPLEGYSKMSPKEIVVRGTAVYQHMNGNPNFPAPPVNLEVFRAALERLSALIAEALDGSRKVIAERNRQLDEVIDMMRLLGRYVEFTSEDDMAIFRSSGFDPAPTTKTQRPPLSENIRNLEHGAISGQIVVWIKAVKTAFSYELRHAALDDDRIPTTWITRPVTNVKGPIVVNDLTPGTTYAFQVRTLENDGYTDWSNSVTFICT